MARKRFNATEKSLISAAMAGKYGQRIEWQNVTQWHSAMLVGDGEIVTGDGGWQHVVALNLDATKTVGKGQVIHVSPGHIRAIPSTAPNGASAMSEQTTTVDTDASVNGTEETTSENGHSGYGKRKFDQGYAAGQQDMRAAVQALLSDPGNFTETTSAEEFAGSLAEALGLDYEPAAE